MTTQELEQRLTAQIKQYVVKSGHVSSGHLADTIRVEVKQNLQMSVVAPDYVQYLDNGNFVENFFELDSTIATIETYLAEFIEDL